MAQGGAKITMILGLFLVVMVSAQDVPFNKTAHLIEAAAIAARHAATEKPKPVLTGIPQIDYIHDPNLPYELKGYDLSDYPFYSRVPNVEFNFTCDDRLDGFYASIPHKCQVYHNCLFGVRYDFLCANFTVFDQSNFICHFASQVDCKNSEFYYDKNEELYVEATTPSPRVKIVYVDRNSKPRRRPGNRKHPRKPPSSTAKPDDYYYDYNEAETKPSKLSNTNADDYYYDEPSSPTTSTTTTTTTKRPLPKRRGNRPLKTREGAQNRNNPDIADGDQNERQPGRNNQRRNGNRPQGKRRRRRKKKTTTTTTTTTTPASDYYDDYYEYYYDEEPVIASTTPKSFQNRRKALLQSRKAQRQSSAPKKIVTEAPVYDDYVYDDPVVAEDAPQPVEDTSTQATNLEENINARRPGSFSRPQSSRSRSRTPRE